MSKTGPSSALRLESPPGSPTFSPPGSPRDVPNLSGFRFTLSTQYSGDYQSDWHIPQVEVQGLDASWLDPTPTPSFFGLNDLSMLFSANLDCQEVEPQQETPSKQYLLQQRNERDYNSAQFALRAYEHQTDRKLELVAVAQRNLLVEYGKGFVHMNFLARPCGMQSATTQMFFAEVHPDCRDEADVYLCCALQENDHGTVMGASLELSFLGTLATGLFLVGTRTWFSPSRAPPVIHVTAAQRMTHEKRLTRKVTEYI
ncbi:hypothetical protein ACP4OV_011092 [Aristida adscensionis]